LVTRLVLTPVKLPAAATMTAGDRLPRVEIDPPVWVILALLADAPAAPVPLVVMVAELAIVPRELAFSPVPLAPNVTTVPPMSVTIELASSLRTPSDPWPFVTTVTPVASIDPPTLL